MKLYLILFLFWILLCSCNSNANEHDAPIVSNTDTIIKTKKQDERFCTFLDFNFDVRGYSKNAKGEWKLIPFYEFNEYDSNRENLPFPDSVCLKTYISNPSYTEGGANVGDFYIRVYVQIKSSLSYSCLMPINARISDTIQVIRAKKFTHLDFFKGNIELESNYRNIDLNSSFSLKEEMKKLNEKFQLSKKYMLNQIIVTAFLFQDSDFLNSCKIEYIYPICVKEIKTTTE